MKITNAIKTLDWHPNRRWSERKLVMVNKIIIHQELGEGNIKAVNNYHIRPNHISDKGCPHFCYHYGIEKTGEIVQANDLKNIVWHTKGQNSTGIGIMVVGNFSGRGYNLGTSEPNMEQIHSVELLTDYLLEAFGLSNQEIYGHYHFGKPACPGTILEEWIENRRKLIVDIPNITKINKTIKEVQKRLKQLGYNCGKVDGIPGIKTLGCIRTFQKDNGLRVDGIVGPITWKVLLYKTLN